MGPKENLSDIVTILEPKKVVTSAVVQENKPGFQSYNAGAEKSVAAM